MITKINFDRHGDFVINGVLKNDYVDFESQKIDAERFYPLMVQMLIEIKKTIIKNLADDNKITGDERVQVINSIDKFLTLLLSFAFITSSEKYLYSDNIDKKFEITISLNKTNYINGKGKLLFVSTADIKDFDPWIDEKIIGIFKTMISLFNDIKNRVEMKKTLVKLIYNVLSLRLKIEYI
ncbi:MAG: hypothetical protein JXB50_06945 [Spirochaetes bacterium]|nr:hypothetical protein [Spirochaetota bacterium]